MDVEIKRKWIEALRSGKYNQAQRELFRFRDEEYENPVAYCCIGVGNHLVLSGTCLADLVTSEVGRALGLDEDQIDKLVELNDDEEASFAEIADYIEKNL